MTINKENIQKAIDVMRRVADIEDITNRKLFYLPYYQARNEKYHGEEIFKTEDEVINHCGTTCCFVGWLGVSPEFRELGITINSYGNPIYMDRRGRKPIQDLLRLSCDEYENLIYGSPYDNGSGYYGKPAGDVTAEDVIQKLEGLLNER